MIERIAAHEAGHSIALLASGFKVSKIVARLTGGSVDPSAPTAAIPPDARLLIALAGSAAETLFCGDGEMSGCDADLAGDAAAELEIYGRANRARLESDASCFVYLHADEIEFLAERLAHRGVLSADALGRLCREAGSPLKKYAWLYVEPKPANRSKLSHLGRPKQRRFTAAERGAYYNTVPEGETQTLRQLCY